jgi:hypothetical protein
VNIRGNGECTDGGRSLSKEEKSIKGAFFTIEFVFRCGNWKGS